MESKKELYRTYLAVTKVSTIDGKKHFKWEDAAKEINQSGLFDMTEQEVEGYRDILLLLLREDEKQVFLAGEKKLLPRKCM